MPLEDKPQSHHLEMERHQLEMARIKTVRIQSLHRGYFAHPRQVVWDINIAPKTSRALFVHPKMVLRWNCQIARKTTKVATTEGSDGGDIGMIMFGAVRLPGVLPPSRNEACGIWRQR